ncbi:MFS transporter [Microbacterium awajiense]|uniref:MFS transporter n=1 Tax=Microbacterium awajiense TaxID=415214 RepID=A0ABP7A2N2_9MICO
MNSDSASRARRSIPWLVIAGVLVAALSLRGPIVAPTPVMREIETDVGIGPAAAGLLTTAPVLMFALLTPVAALVIRRAGAELALLAALSGVLLGTFVRALPGFGWMLTGMVVIGVAIAVGNVVIPVIIRRDVPAERVVVVTAAYAATLNIGSLLTSLLTAPLAAAIGWSAALVAWSAITAVGIVLWSVHLRRERARGRTWGERYSGAHGATPAAAASDDIDPDTLTGPMPVVAGGRRERRLLRRPVAWLIAASFALQCTVYWALTTWLPTIAADELGYSPAAAGAVASIYQGVGVLGAFLVPLLTRFAPRAVATAVICASWLVLMVGLLAWPELLGVWLIAGAIAHAGGFVVIFTLLVQVSRDDAEAAGLSAFVQGVGYAVGALGAPLSGLLHEATGGWTAPLIGMLVLAVVYSGTLLGASALASRR